MICHNGLVLNKSIDFNVNFAFGTLRNARLKKKLKPERRKKMVFLALNQMLTLLSDAMTVRVHLGCYDDPSTLKLLLRSEYT